MPSVIAYRKGERKIGTTALKTAPDNMAFVWCPNNYHYTNFAQIDDACFKLKLTKEGDHEVVTKQEAVARLLVAIKELILEAGVEESCLEKVVLTIPDFATQHHRKMLLQASDIAGFEKVHLIQHSTAAAIFYSDNMRIEKKRYLLVVHFGGRSVSVSIYLRHEDGTMEIISSAGDLFGGEDLTSEIVEVYESQIEADIGRSVTPRESKDIRHVCEAAKIMLDSSKDVDLHFEIEDSEYPEKSKEWDFTLSRKQFEKIVKPFFAKMNRFLEQATGSIQDEAIHDVLLMGAASRMPQIKGLVEKYVKRPDYLVEILPEEAVVKAAAIKAAMLAGNERFQAIKVSKVPMRPLLCDFEKEDEKDHKYIAGLDNNVEEIPSLRRKEKFPAGVKPSNFKVYEYFDDKYKFDLAFKLEFGPPTKSFKLISYIDDNGIIDVSIQVHKFEKPKSIVATSIYPIILPDQEIQALKRKVHGLEPEKVSIEVDEAEIKSIVEEIQFCDRASEGTIDIGIVDDEPIDVETVDDEVGSIAENGFLTKPHESDAHESATHELELVKKLILCPNKLCASEFGTLGEMNSSSRSPKFKSLRQVLNKESLPKKLEPSATSSHSLNEELPSPSPSLRKRHGQPRKVPRIPKNEDVIQCQTPTLSSLEIRDSETESLFDEPNTTSLMPEDMTLDDFRIAIKKDTAMANEVIFSEEMEETTNSNSHFCNLCYIECKGEFAYQIHLNGQPHKRRATLVGQLGEFSCKLCIVDAGHFKNLVEHFKGRQHQKMLANAKKAKTTYESRFLESALESTTESSTPANRPKRKLSNAPKYAENSRSNGDSTQLKKRKR